MNVPENSRVSDSLFVVRTFIQKGDVMKLEEIRRNAKSLGLHPSHFSKTKLIKTLQKWEGNFDCFATARFGECDQTNCIWRGDCFETARKGALS
jgi:hypothetical protein